MMLLSGHLFASNKSFIKHDTEVFATNKGTKNVGLIETATPVEELASFKTMKKVKLTGWVSYGFENVVFRDVGERIFYVILDDAMKKNAKKSTKRMDSFGTQWRKVSYVFWINKKALTKNKSEIMRKGQDLFATRCGACHASPEVKHYTSNQWPSIIEAMKLRAGLSTQEAKVITKYLQDKTFKGGSHGE